MNILKAISAALSYPFVLRDKFLWQKWERAQEIVRKSPGARIGCIERVRQNARTGTKGYIRWHQESGTEPIWVPHYHAGRRFVIVRGNRGYGDHHGEQVFYVKEILCVLPGSAYRGWCRHNKRIQTRPVEQRTSIRRSLT
jgi:hypothetical protein